MYFLDKLFGKKRPASLNYVSKFSDENLFHILSSEVFPLSRFDLDVLGSRTLFLVETDIDKASVVQNWRYFVLSKIFEKVEYISQDHLHKIAQPIKIKAEFGFNCWKFIDYDSDWKFRELAGRIRKKSTGAARGQPYVLLNQRNEDDRFLYDIGSKEPLQDFLASRLDQLGIPFKHCNFSKLSPQSQAGVCSQAGVFVSAHGAGISNLIFTRQDCPLIEINFRKFWFCDPVCDKHFSGELKYNEKCDGGLHYRPYFHKADFHNLCHLLGKRYIELEAEMYEGYRSKNPISRKKMFVDGRSLLSHILPIVKRLPEV